jgi:hypothetical protein
MKFENLVFKIVESAAADQAKVGDVLLVLAAPTEAARGAGDELQGGPAHMLLFGGAMPEPGVTGAKYGPKHAIAGVAAGATPARNPNPWHWLQLCLASAIRV